MKISVILTAASFCLAGLTVAAPIVDSPVSEIVRIDENGVKDVDIEYFVTSIKPIDERHKIGNDWSNLGEDEKKFIGLLMQEIQNHDLVEEFVYKLLQPVVDGSEVSSESKESDREVDFKAHGAPEMDKRYYGAGYGSPGAGFGSPGVTEAFDWLYKNGKDTFEKIGKAFERAFEQGILPAKPGQWHLCQLKDGCGANDIVRPVTSDKESSEIEDSSPTSSAAVGLASSTSLSLASSDSSSVASSGTSDDLGGLISLVLSFIDI